MRFLLAATIVFAQLVAAEEKISILLAGAHTELDGAAAIDSWVTPLIFDPGTLRFAPGDPVRLKGSIPFDDDDTSWELTLAYRVTAHVQVQAGYTDFGSFDSDFSFPSGSFSSVGIPGAIARFDPFGGLVRPSPVAAFAIATRPEVKLDIDAWLLGIKADYPLWEKTRVYGRVGALRARFDISDNFGASTDFIDPSDETSWYWGAGLQYQILPRLYVGAGYNQYDVDLQRLDSYQLSLEWVVL